MATRGLGAAGAAEDKNAALRKLVYEACVEAAEDEPDITFYQETLIDLDVLPSDDVAILLAVTQGLTNEKLFKVVQDPQRGLGWKIRSEEEAKKYVFSPNLPLRSTGILIFIQCSTSPY
jgi:DNA-directed RNA polymerase III subunit RPC6